MSDGVGTAIRYALVARGADSEGLVYLELSDSAAPLLDSARLRTSLQPWVVEFDSVAPWFIRGAVGCQCAGAVYAGPPSPSNGITLTQDVSVIVPVWRAATYRMTLRWRDPNWVLQDFKVLITS
jgi:hypothetical protein